MKTRFFLLIISLLFVLLSGCGSKQEDNILKSPEEIIADLRESTVMIYAGELHGTGVIIGNDQDTITIATVAHLMKDYDQGLVNFFSGQTGFGNVVFIDDISDICLLTMKVSDFYDDFGKTIKPATIEEGRLEKLNQYDKVILLGSSINVGANATYGKVGSTDYYVHDYDQNMIYLYADAMSGMSGSGCYTEDGVLIGILSAGSESSEVLCIKINDYINEWNNLQ